MASQELTEDNKRTLLDGVREAAAMDDVSSVISEAMSFSTSGHMSSTGEGTNTDSNKNLREVMKHTRRETKRVETWRELVTGVLVITASLVATTTFIYLNREEISAFKEAVSHSFSRILDTTKCQWHCRISNLTDVSLYCTSRAVSIVRTNCCDGHRERRPTGARPSSRIEQFVGYLCGVCHQLGRILSICDAAQL